VALALPASAAPGDGATPVRSEPVATYPPVQAATVAMTITRQMFSSPSLASTPAAASMPAPTIAISAGRYAQHLDDGGTHELLGRASANHWRAVRDRLATSRFDVEQFRMGLEVELEHGRRDPATNVSDDDELTTGKIAWAHLNEFPDYYTRLARMEAEAERYWADHDRGLAE
jgi:Protein of unknown function (DUF5661)